MIITNSMKKKRIVRILRMIMPIVAILSAMVFVPWDIVPWITPLPDTVQEQVDDAIDHGLEMASSFM
jgi:D-alanyl-D-alanine carboxypeptidase